MAGQAAAIAAVDLVKRFGRVTALAGLTLTVPAGEAIGFLGPNGAGKTTAVKLLLGLTRPTSGVGTVLGAPLGDRRRASAHRLPAGAVSLPGVAVRARGAATALRACAGSRRATRA